MKSIGRYEIESEIGRGAMGVVYRAHDPELRRTVAVKTYALPPGLDESQQAEFRSRFRREARAAAALSHRNIVTVFDAGEDPRDGTPFLAMEYVPGRSLAEVLESEGAVSLDRVRAIACDLAAALEAAHAAGIVHRDVKPANVLVRDSDGAVKIADFGVARVASSTLTRTGSSVGSPAYMSPEQIRGMRVDGRSDLFSLAGILYEMLCARRPFSGDDVSELVYSVAHETPIPVSRLDPALPGSLDDFFDRALAKEPGDRFPDAATFGSEFERAASGFASRKHETLATVVGSPGPAAVPDAAPPRPRWRTTVLAAAAGFGIMLAGVLIFGREEAHLLLDAKSRVDGRLEILVDGEEVFRRALVAPDPPPRTAEDSVPEDLAEPGGRRLRRLRDPDRRRIRETGSRGGDHPGRGRPVSKRVGSRTRARRDPPLETGGGPVPRLERFVPRRLNGAAWRRSSVTERSDEKTETGTRLDPSLAPFRPKEGLVPGDSVVCRRVEEGASAGKTVDFSRGVVYPIGREKADLTRDDAEVSRRKSARSTGT